MTAETTRFAPSPSGYLHLGHAYSALFSQKAAKVKAGGRFLLRIEDIDQARCRPEFEQAIFEDLSWLGLAWEGDVMRQSQRLALYGDALARLRREGLVYPCYCTRKEIAVELAAAVSAPHDKDASPIYPGTCRNLSQAAIAAHESQGRMPSWRLDSKAAANRVGPLVWEDLGRGALKVEVEAFGDVVLARRDIHTSYHLAVTLDDAAQGVTLVTRGEDLLSSTPIHRLLQALLELPVPRWMHHELIRDDGGERLAKRRDSMALRHLREEGRAAEDLRRVLGFA